MEARNDTQLANIRWLTGKICAFQAALVVAHSALAREEAQRREAEAALHELEGVKAAAEAPSALEPSYTETAAVGKKAKKAKKALKSPAKPILLHDSAVELVEPKSPASSPDFDLSLFCWCDEEGWNCMCGLPDANWIKPDRKSNSFWVFEKSGVHRIQEMWPLTDYA